MGVKKSTVCTNAHSGVSLYTPASSAVSNPTSTFSFAQRGIRASTWSKTFGLNLEAQPAAEVCAVRWPLVVGTRLGYKNSEFENSESRMAQQKCGPRTGKNLPRLRGLAASSPIRARCLEA